MGIRTIRRQAAACPAPGWITVLAMVLALLGSPSATPAQQLKVFISVDLEGIAGLVDDSQLGAGGHDYALGRGLAEGETNAAIAAAYDAGATEVVVIDSHGGKTNLRPDRLDPRATLITGGPRPYGMIHGIDETFDAVAFIGFHAMAGTRNALHDHIYTGQIKRVTLNGRPMGEAGLAGAVAGHFGVPVVFLSGDRAAAEEARATFPGIETVSVKEAIGRNAARTMHPERARERIADGVRRAVAGREAVAPLRIDAPVTMDIELSNPGQADQVMFVPGMERVGPNTVRFTAVDVLQAYQVSRLARLLAR